MLLTASLVQGVSSQGQFFQSNLATSTLSPSGAIVNQSSGLPTAFFSPGLGLSNNVFRQHLFNVGLTDAIGPNSYSLYGSYNEYQSLTTTTSAPTKSLGVNLGYSRDIRPDLSGYASVGYVNSVNSPTVTTVPSTTGFNTVSANLSLNYVLGRTLTGSILYNFSYQSTGTVLIGGHAGEVFVNQLELLLSKTF
jgi:hypothetical protein